MIERRRTITKAVESFAAMSWPERRELVVVVLLAAACEAMVRWRPLSSLAATFGVALAERTDHPADPMTSLPEWARMRLRITRRVMRNWPVDGVCLRHALVAGHRIRRLDPVLRVGVASEGVSSINAHAWLEVGGRSLDVEATDYLAFSL